MTADGSPPGRADRLGPRRGRSGGGIVTTLAALTCPRHHADLSGGPVIFHCPAGSPHGHAVTAADAWGELEVAA